MLISTGVLAGTAVFAACVLTTDKMVKKKLDSYKLIVDPATSKAYIKCSARDIPLENFKVYTRVEHSQIYLYTKGAAVTASNDIVKVEYKYHLKNVPMADIQRMTWDIDDEDYLVVEIPLSAVSRKMAIRRVR